MSGISSFRNSQRPASAAAAKLEAFARELAEESPPRPAPRPAANVHDDGDSLSPAFARPAAVRFQDDDLADDVVTGTPGAGSRTSRTPSRTRSATKPERASAHPDLPTSFVVTQLDSLASYQRELVSRLVDSIRNLEAENASLVDGRRELR
eukprot:TRINITY_DN27688_c1_g1_i1.p2 TRINITY_DN27688_c1_g1~~TRINITY_DN27688_c1_g1_i1.p2  ORF type:complete len:151 (+),score=37.55 TRINITY_DN27688_c1_g1_i1:246-698(+)